MPHAMDCISQRLVTTDAVVFANGSFSSLVDIRDSRFRFAARAICSPLESLKRLHRIDSVSFSFAARGDETDPSMNATTPTSTVLMSQAFTNTGRVSIG